MENIGHQQQAAGAFERAWSRVKAFPGGLNIRIMANAKAVKKLAQDDPRRVTHSLKVGLALTLVSLLYYTRPLYDGFGVSGMWAVLTVAVIFEFTVGKLLSNSKTIFTDGNIVRINKVFSNVNCMCVQVVP